MQKQIEDERYEAYLRNNTYSIEETKLRDKFKPYVTKYSAVGKGALEKVLLEQIVNNAQLQNELTTSKRLHADTKYAMHTKYNALSDKYVELVDKLLKETL